MPKNIVVFSDGTGQEGGKGAAMNTNVYRAFNLLEDRTPRQVAFYDPGLGTGWRKVTGNIAGAGLSQNILEAYRFILDNYEAGDRIFLMGFSRGATTVRSLSGFIHHFGILPKSRPDLIKEAYRIYRTRAPLFKWWARRIIASKNLTDPVDLSRAMYAEDTASNLESVEHLLPVESAGKMPEGQVEFDEHVQAVRNLALNRKQELSRDRKKEEAAASAMLAKHRVDGSGTLKDPRQFVRAFRLKQRAHAFLAANHNQWTSIEVLACYDTVAALGLPIPGLNALINMIPGMQHDFHDLTLSKSVKHAYHALAIDDERKVFAPTMWDPIEDQPEGDHPDHDPQTLRQVWFTGMHTDVGGGYQERGLASVALGWMLQQAHEHGLLIYPRHEPIVEDYTDVMHDSRDKWWARLLYRRKVRSWDLDTKPVVHESVVRRSQAPAIRRSTKGEPVDDDGASYKPWILDSEDYETEPWVAFDTHALVAAQEKKWDALDRIFKA